MASGSGLRDLTALALGGAFLLGGLVFLQRRKVTKEEHRGVTLQRSKSILIRPSHDARSPQTKFRRSNTVVGAHHGRLLAVQEESSPTSSPTSPTSKGGKAGVLVHGCHMQADGWEEIVWGNAPDRLGRLPQAVLLAFEEDAAVIVLGTGASVSADGRLEGQYTLDTLLERLPRLHDFKALQRFPLEDLKRFVKRVAVAELESQNTIQEVRAAFHIMCAREVGRVFLVSSPTHLPRCLACACQAHEEDEAAGRPTFNGEIYASPSETCYEGFQAGDVVVVEPPHRGDRDKDLDDLPFHEMVKRTFKVPRDQRVQFLKDFEKLLSRYSA
eukprot:TRINITY_DN30428_c0_g2_i1.p1 TRINITY_DN30428_c0_g2~~TRINITY_DN30428_c0_g2_i1.p1  ORF type:complete len:328 (-),score=56.43 TRINITY_DN30428_c0_g2_i1:87-1070(-)